MNTEIKIDEKKLNKKLIILVIIVIILSIVLILNNKESRLDNSDFEKSMKDESNQGLITKYKTEIDDQASVTIKVTPKIIGVKLQENIFELSLNTHSVDLAYDFQKIIVLRDNLGNIYKASDWTGGRGGHHLKGEIIFSEIDKDAKTIEMEVNEVGGVKRIFHWDIQ